MELVISRRNISFAFKGFNEQSTPDLGVEPLLGAQGMGGAHPALSQPLCPLPIQFLLRSHEIVPATAVAGLDDKRNGPVALGARRESFSCPKARNDPIIPQNSGDIRF